MKKFFLADWIKAVHTNRYKVEDVINEEGKRVLFISYETDEEYDEIGLYLDNLPSDYQELYDDKDFFVCDECGKIKTLGDATEVGSGLICGHCEEVYYAICDHCGRLEHIDNLNHIADSDENWCNDCTADDAVRCNDCGEYVQYYSRTYDGDYICEDCRDDNYYYCDGCGDYVHRNDVYSDDDCYYCPRCWEDHDSSSRAVRSYHDNPRRVFHKAEDEETTKFIGCEIETEKGDYESRVEITQEHGEDELYIYQMKDGSLDSDGIECITQPMSKKFFDQFDFESWFRDLKDAGARSHNTSNCGLHIHLSHEWFGDDEEKQDIICGLCVEVMSNFQSKLNKFARRSSERWASYDFIEYSETFSDKIEKAKKKGKEKSGRYKALNRCNRSTIEFRIFKGTLNPETFRASVEMCIRLVEFSKWIYNHKKKDYSWEEFLTFKKLPSVLENKINQFVR